MEPYFELADLVEPGNTMSQTEAIKCAVWFCIDHEFIGPEEALKHLRSKDLIPVCYE